MTTNCNECAKKNMQDKCLYIVSYDNVASMYLLHDVSERILTGGHGGRVVTLSPPTSEAGVRYPHGLKWESW